MVCGAQGGGGPSTTAASQRLWRLLTTNIGVTDTVDSKVVVGRRLHHRTGVHRPHAQGQSSPLWPQWAAAWPLVPLYRIRAPSSGRVCPIFWTHMQPISYVTHMSDILTQPSGSGKKWVRNNTVNKPVNAPRTNVPPDNRRAADARSIRRSAVAAPERATMYTVTTDTLCP